MAILRVSRIQELLFQCRVLVYKGLIPARDDDTAAFGFYYGRLSEVAPSGVSSADAAIVDGGEIGIIF